MNKLSDPDFYQGGFPCLSKRFGKSFWDVVMTDGQPVTESKIRGAKLIELNRRRASIGKELIGSTLKYTGGVPASRRNNTRKHSTKSKDKVNEESKRTKDLKPKDNQEGKEQDIVPSIIERTRSILQRNERSYYAIRSDLVGKFGEHTYKLHKPAIVKLLQEANIKVRIHRNPKYKARTKGGKGRARRKAVKTELTKDKIGRWRSRKVTTKSQARADVAAKQQALISKIAGPAPEKPQKKVIKATKSNTLEVKLKALETELAMA